MERMQRDGLIAVRGGQPAAPVAVGPVGAWQWPGRASCAPRREL
ncbi:MAG: hypothetical protein WKG07_40960 [Hymenobacter sp.]